MRAQSALLAHARPVARSRASSRARGRRRAAPADRLPFIALLGLMLALPFTLGSFLSYTPRQAMSAVLFLIAAWWLLALARGRVDVTPALHAARLPLALLALWVAYVGLHLVPLPMGVLDWLAPNTAGHYRALASQGLVVDSAPLTLDVRASSEALVESLAYALLFALVLVMVRDRARFRTLSYTLVASGVLHALIGASVVLGGQQHYASSGFVNQNLFGGYLVMALCAGVALMLSDPIESERRRDFRRLLRYLSRLLLSEKVAIRLLLVALVVGVVMSASRGANVALAVALVAMGATSLLARRRIDRRLAVLLVSMAVVDLVIVGAWFGLDRVRDELQQTSMSTEGRAEQHPMTLDLIQASPVLGNGAGGYATVFPAHRQDSPWRHHFPIAHSDHLEFLAETGIVGYALLGLFVLSTAWRAWRLMAPGRPPADLALGVASMGLIAAIMWQSAVDCGLQYAPYGFTFVMLLALVWTRPDAAGGRAGQ